MLWKRTIAAVVIAISATCFAGCASVTQKPLDPYLPPPAPAFDTNTCTTAAQLTHDGNPKQALALIAAYRAGATVKATPKDPNATCENERQNALRAQSRLENGATLSNPGATFAAMWDRFVATWVTPFTGAFLVAASTLLVLLVAARLFVFIPWPTSLLPKSRIVRRVLGCVGAVVIVGLAAFLPASLSLFMPTITVAWVLLAALACSLLAIAMATRLRLFIDAQDANEPAASARLVGMVSELGAAPPKGLEIPQGSDVTALKDVALSAPGGNGFINALTWLANSLFTATPWRAALAPSAKDAEQLTLVITRNGRAHSAYVISARKLIQTPPPPPAPKRKWFTKAPPPADDAKHPLQPYLYEIAAAAIVVTLSKANTGFDGLCGAEDWRSVGLHYVATSRYLDDDDVQRRLLVKALDYDPHNFLAEVALQHLERRQSKDADEIQEYIDWLDARSDNLVQESENLKIRKGYEAAHRRMQLTSLALRLNRNWEKDWEPKKHVWKVDEDTRGRAVELLSELESSENRADVLIAQQRLAAVLFHATAFQEAPQQEPYDRWFDTAIVASSPTAAFNAACYYCTRYRPDLECDAKGKDESAETAIAKITDRLKVVALDPDKAEKARHDPVLESYAAAPWFKSAIGAKTSSK